MARRWEQEALCDPQTLGTYSALSCQTMKLIAKYILDNVSDPFTPSAASVAHCQSC